MNDTTLAKIITDDVKVVAFKRVIRATEFTDETTIFRLTNFSIGGWAEDTDFTNETDLMHAFREFTINNL